MHTWVIYICILFAIYLAYQWIFETRPSYYVRRMKYMMERLEPKPELPEDIHIHTELWMYQYTSLYNMISYMFEQFDFIMKRWIHGFYIDFIMPFLH